MRHSYLTRRGGGPGQPPWPPPLVAVAHGSRDPAAADTIAGLMDLTAARAARAGLPGLTVRAAYLGHARPSVADVLEGLARPTPGPGGERPVVVLPLLLTEAYHSDTDLPAVLREEAARDRPGQRLGLHYGAPLGPHPGLARALERRLAEAGVPAAPADAARTAVVLAAAGSSRPAANAAVARAARAWQSARGWRRVVPAYASAASPTPGEAVAALLRAGADRVVVATYLLAPGVFADQVRDQSLAAGAQAVSAPLGAAPEVAGVLLERYLQAVPVLPCASGDGGLMRRASPSPVLARSRGARNE
jgi:sirohydrochlorin ferrochelatase